MSGAWESRWVLSIFILLLHKIYEVSQNWLSEGNSVMNIGDIVYIIIMGILMWCLGKIYTRKNSVIKLDLILWDYRKLISTGQINDWSWILFRILIYDV